MNDPRLLSEAELASVADQLDVCLDAVGRALVVRLMVHDAAQRERIKRLAHENETLRAAMVVEGVA